MTLLYAREKNSLTKEYEVINQEEAKAKGWEQYDVEFDMNTFKWYLIGYTPAAPEPTYAELRQQEYPPVEEQLDMLYWDKVNGTNDWADLITEIKEKYPKPAAETNNADALETSISAENEADDQNGSGNNDTAEQDGNASLHEDDEEE